MSFCRTGRNAKFIDSAPVPALIRQYIAHKHFACLLVRGALIMLRFYRAAGSKVGVSFAA